MFKSVGSTTGVPETNRRSMNPLILPLDEMTNVASPAYDPPSVPTLYVVWITSAAPLSR
jgi:hypothetical protein